MTFIFPFVMWDVDLSMFPLVIFLPAMVLGAIQEHFMMQLKHRCLEKP